MCHTTTSDTDSQQLPLAVGSGSLDGMSGPLDSIGDTSPATASVTSPHPSTFGRLLELVSMGAYDPTGGVDTGKFNNARPTKWGALLNVVRPVMEGAVVGGLEGRSTPGGGFAAAQNLFERQRLEQMKREQFQASLAKMRSDLAKNEAETQYYNRGGNTRIGQPVVGDNGNYWSVNPVTRELEDTGVGAPAKPEEWSAPFTTNRGYAITNKKTGETRLLQSPSVAATTSGGGVPRTLPGQAESAMEPGSTESASVPSRVAQGGGALQSPSGIAAMAASAPLTLAGGAEKNRNSRSIPTTPPNGKTKSPVVGNGTEALQPPQKFTNPFQAFAYGSPDEKQAAQDFIAFEKQQGARNEKPGDIEQRYALFKRDPEAYKAMFGDRGTAQGSRDQAQATRMLNYFAKQRKAIQSDFTLDEAEKQQQLDDIGELEKPYLAAAQLPGNARGESQPRSNSGARNAPKYQRGDTVSYGGQRMKVSRVRSDGKLELQPIGAGAR